MTVSLDRFVEKTELPVWGVEFLFPNKSVMEVTMSINLDLPSELENELSFEASQLQLPLTEYILRVLSLRPFLHNPPKTGAELITYWEDIGVINSRPDIVDSQEYARRLRHEAENRERT